ncbi:hypothetical protein F0562_016323 [Nyssa sinensis]|uniref:DUF3741 domain-containing protein n=1 Tax=Nyssa sinensis TaxID=561372 RepID=A0A5J4ZJG5_9ASTE|nr:hypothetical protein F0562_016323 [Nyssa sinensis]
MGKNMDHKHSGISIKNSHPGCMWSILHVLHYHRWHCLKKMLPHKRHVVGVENPERDINAAKASKMQEHIDAEMDNSLIEEKATEPSPVTKSSVKSRIKALISEEMSKRRGRHSRIDLDNENPKIVHQENKNSSVASALELDQRQSKVCETPVASSEKCDLCATMLAMNYLWQTQVGEHGKKPVENHTLLQDKLNKIKQDLLEQKLIYAKEPSKDFSLHESKQFLDALNMFNTNKELFLKILQDPSSPLAHNFHGRRAFNSKIGLTKSVSFPLAGFSGRRDVGPRKLKHKQETEPWAERGGQLQVGSQAKKLAELESRGNTCEYSVPLIAEHRLDNIPRPHLAMSRSFDNSSPGSPHELKNWHENKIVIKRFKNLKQKIKHAIRESRKEGHRISMDAVLHKIPHGRKLSKDVKKKKDDLQKEPTMGICSNYSPKSSCESDQSISAIGKSGLQQMKRTSSFNESLDRYCQLYESSFNREAKHHISERLKLRTEETPSPVRNAQKSLGRILSLPDLRSFSYLQSDGSPDATSMGTSSRTAVNSIVSRGSSRFDEQKTLGLPMGSENETPVDEPVESESQENSVKVDESYPVTKDEVASTSLTSDEAKSQVGQTLDLLRNLTKGDSASHSEHEICPTAGAAAKMAGPNPISVLDSEFQEDITSHAKFSVSEDLGLKPSCLLFGGVESFTNKQHEAGMDSPTVAKSTAHLEEIETPIKQSDSDFPHFIVSAKDISEFNYVRDVLELSGFSRNEFLGTWHSAGQPVGPSVFDEVEGCFLPEPSSYENEEGGNCTHLLLFDLVNEILLEIHERSVHLLAHALVFLFPHSSNACGIPCS